MALKDPDLATASGRAGHHRRLDEAIGALTATASAGDLARRLREAGVAAERAMTAADLIEDAQLAERQLLTPVVHDEWGERRLVGIPWRRAGGPAVPLGPPPHLVPLPVLGDELRASSPGR
jgi:crotonobetainyl-CoA:carnitine CoA-transferase CaiB-like acyl-CoA transferase